MGTASSLTQSGPSEDKVLFTSLDNYATFKGNFGGNIPEMNSKNKSK